MLQLHERLAPLRARAGLDELSFRLTVLLGQPPLIDATLRLFSAGILPPQARKRFLVAGLEAHELARTLRAIRSLGDWSAAWSAEARRLEIRALAAEVPGTPEGGARAARFWHAASLAYGFAGTAVGVAATSDAALERARLAAFRRAAPGLSPPAEAVTLPWRDTPLPAWLRRPEGATGPTPLVVLFNGAGIVKEEMALWGEAFLARGLAILAFDGPGCGELRGRLATDRGQEDITATILAWADAHPALATDRVALLGVSFGGAQVIHHAARNPRIAALVAVTPPFDPAPYVDRVHQFVMAEIAALVGATGAAEIVARAGDLSCVPFVEAVHCPTLTIGAAMDTILPPTEAGRLHRALPGPDKTLVYLRRATHIGLSHLDVWTVLAAEWLALRLLPVATNV
jgi:2,6-dihydroxypseudooxynicotine hydrolase